MQAVESRSKPTWDGVQLVWSRTEPLEAGPGKDSIMSAILRTIRQFVRDEEGATATEYAVMLALIIMACIGAVSALGTKVSAVFANTEQEWSNYSP
jgi:pilus assembly protein Flp/PilA